MSPSSVPDGAKTPILADDTSRVGINDQSWSRAKKQDRGGRGTPLHEHMVDRGVSKAGISEPAKINPAELKEFKKVPMWTSKEKGKAVAGPSEKPAARFVELESDDEDDGDVDFELAMVEIGRAHV